MHYMAGDLDSHSSLRELGINDGALLYTIVLPDESKED